MVNPLTVVEAIARAVANVSGEAAQRDGENNTPEMRAAAALAEIGKIVDEHRKAIANEDLEAERRMLAEPAAGGIAGNVSGQ